MVGYAIETKSDVRVYVDRTTTSNFQLKTAAFVGEEVTITAARDPVPLDVSSTESYVTGEDVVESPIGRLDQLMGYQAGVEFTQTQTDARKGFHVRGGDVQETDVQIDGISVMNKQSLQPAIPLSRNLIQDVQILTGGFNAEYGNIRSGLINIITKDGSYNRYSGVLEGRISPTAVKHYGGDPYAEGTPHYDVYWDTESSLGIGNPAFEGVPKSETFHYILRPDKKYYYSWPGWDSFAKNKPNSANFHWEKWKWQHRPITYADSPDIMADVSGGGPVPFLNNTKFYASAFWNRSEWVLIGSRPRSHEYNTSLKITKRIKQNMTLVFSGFSTFVHGIHVGDREDADRLTQTAGTLGTTGLDQAVMTGDDKIMYAKSALFGSNRTYSPCWLNQQEAVTHTISTKFTHTISPRTYYEVNLIAQLYDGDVHHMRGTDPKIIKYIYDEKTDQDIGFDEYPNGYVERGYKGYGRKDEANRFDMNGYSKGIIDNLVNDFVITGNIVSQVNKSNQLKAGIYLAKTHINERNYYSIIDRWIPIEERPYEWSKYKADPFQFDFYVQDKLEWEGMIVNFGIRGLTYFPNKDGFDVTRDNMFVYREGKSLWNAVQQWGTVEGEGNWMFQEMRTRKTRTSMIIQPRLGISHPITESSKIFFNYGHFISQPKSGQMFLTQSVWRLCQPKWGTGVLGVPDLKWPKTVAYEIGYSQSIYNQFLLQISGYYKDYGNIVNGYRFMSYTADVDIMTFANNSYRDIRGLEFRVERSFGRFLNGWTNYNYMITSTGSTGFKFLYQDPQKDEAQFFVHLLQTRDGVNPCNHRLSALIS